MSQEVSRRRRVHFGTSNESFSLRNPEDPDRVPGGGPSGQRCTPVPRLTSRDSLVSERSLRLLESSARDCYSDLVGINFDYVVLPSPTLVTLNSMGTLSLLSFLPIFVIELRDLNLMVDV